MRSRKERGNSYVVLSPETVSASLILVSSSLWLLIVGVVSPIVGVVEGVWLDKKSGGLSEDG